MDFLGQIIKRMSLLGFKRICQITVKMIYNPFELQSDPALS